MIQLLLLILLLLSMSDPALAGNDISFAAFDYGFSGPDTIPAGITILEVVNQGQQLHHIQLVKRLEAKTAADFNQALKAEPGHLPKWAALSGGPNAIGPGDRASAIVKLEPGNYILICLIPDTHNTPHFALGMAKPIKVVGTPVSSARFPDGDLEFKQVDFSFSLPPTITSGSHMIHVTNRGAQAHEVVVVKLAPEASVMDFIRALEPGAAGPAPPARRPANFSVA